MSPKVSIIIPSYNVEQYIEDMLTAVEKQTMRDFEAIIVNDGSTDNTQNIIDKFCAKDTRFKSFVKENGGVSSARNMGLDNAQGKYVVFWDPDDYVPPKSLEALCEQAEKTGADLVIGKNIVNKVTERTEPLTLKKLIHGQEISKMDGQLVWVFSAANKLYKRELIEQHKLRFVKSSLGEDSIFWMEYLNIAEKVFGCDEEVYEYKKRHIVDGNPSLTQKADRYFEGYFEEYIGTILRLSENNFSQAKIEDDEKNYYREKFHQETYKRFLRNNLLGDMYRNIWILTDKELQLMYETFEDLRAKTYPLEWNLAMYEERDLDIKDKLYTKDDLLEKVKLTFVLTEALSIEEAEKVLRSIYAQKQPMFEVLIGSDMYERLNIIEKDKENCFKIDVAEDISLKNAALERAKGQWIVFFDEAIVPGETTYKKFLDAVTQEDKIVSLYYELYINNKITEQKIFGKAFMWGNKGILKEVDTALSNKIINVEYLRGKNFKFTDNPQNDMLKLYQYGIRKKPKNKMLSLKEKNFKIGLKTKIKIKILGKLLR